MTFKKCMSLPLIRSILKHRILCFVSCRKGGEKEQLILIIAILLDLIMLKVLNLIDFFWWLAAALWVPEVCDALQIKPKSSASSQTWHFFKGLSLGSQQSWCNSRNIEDENELFLVGAEVGGEFSKRRWREDSVFGSEGAVSVLFLWLYWVQFLAGSVALHPSDNSPAWLSIVSTFQWLK